MPTEAVGTGPYEEENPSIEIEEGFVIFVDNTVIEAVFSPIISPAAPKVNSVISDDNFKDLANLLLETWKFGTTISWSMGVSSKFKNSTLKSVVVLAKAAVSASKIISSGWKPFSSAGEI